MSGEGCAITESGGCSTMLRGVTTRSLTSRSHVNLARWLSEMLCAKAMDATACDSLTVHEIQSVMDAAERDGGTL